ncbi:restriction endonuclease subunit S [Helicobacter pylori]|uniref:restriction endonuclease subunit S n=1 Tax=Helicobacter pylori TaxID=210 RepID=UPI000665AC87|nr:restriction endonuclease subunit S [Helicobacter pylori]KMT69744.1 hypothetical protein AB991_02435 [Helicobacter pylori]
MDALTTPSNWQKVRLGDIINIKHGRDYKNFKLGNIPVYGSGGYMLSINNFLHNGESVCIGRKGTIDKPIYLNGKFWVVDTLFYSYSFKKSIPKFIFYAFSIIKWSNYNEATGVPSLTKMTISNIEIPLPPLNEQIAIADILSALDNYLHALRALILKKEGVKKALSFELLSQRKRLKGFNQAWQRVKVKDFGIIITGSTPLTQISEYWNGTISWITPTDINDNKDIFNSERKITQKGLDTIRMIPKNSVLVTCIASIGKNAILRVNGACNQQINAIIPNKDFNADFIYYLMENNKQYLLGKAGVTATYIISKQVFEEIDFFVPKDLNEQIAIANILSALDHEIISLKNKKRQFENIKKALNHDLMSAKIRVLKK